MRLFALGVLLSGCASAVEALPRYEPLVCDPVASSHVAFGVQEAGAFFEGPGFTPYGRRFLVIDRSCRFWAVDPRVDELAIHGRVRAGTLTDEELMAIDAELLRGPWERVDGEHYDMLGADASTVSLWRDELGASCYQHCDDRASPALRSMFDVGWAWARRLAERASPVDGSMQLLLRGGLMPRPDALELTATDLSLGTDTVRGFLRVLVEDPRDVATLRAVRGRATSIVLRQGGEYFYGAAVDVIPHSDDRGVLRPPFPIRE